MLKLAWKFMIYDKPKSVGALAGTIISVFLIAQQIGIFIYLIFAMSALSDNNRDYVWVTDDRTTNVNALSPLDNRIGLELESIVGIKDVSPLVVAGAGAKFANGKSAGLMLIGVQAPGFIGSRYAFPAHEPDRLIQEGAVSTDFFDQAAFAGLKLGEYFEINGKKVFNAIQTKGVRSDGAPYSFTTIERARYLTGYPQNKSSAFLVEVDSTVSKASVITSIQSQIPYVKAWDGNDLTKETIFTVLGTSGIVFSFGTLIIFALIVGFAIIGLTLYSATVDRIKDYGTLKAIGASNGVIRKLITTQALLFALIGYAIGMLLTEGFRSSMADEGTIFDYPWWLRISFLVLTILISLSGSLFAMQRITKLEPAQVFRN